MALNVTVALPEPEAPPVMLSHAALLAAVHEHPAALVTAVVEAPPAEVSVREVGETPKVQLTPFCVTVTVCPATVSVPVRSAVDVFAVALKVTVPFPLPLAPLLMVSQAALLAAVQAHPLAAVTPVVDEPAAEVNERDVGDTPNVQLTPLCVTVTVCPAMVSVPTRWAVDVFAVMLKVTVPLPTPLMPAVTTSQVTFRTAVQEHPLGAVTAKVAEPAAEVSVCDVGETPKVQPMPLCVTVTVWPATVSVPTRWAVDGFAVALNVTVPSPAPLAPPVTLSQAALLAAVQLQPPGAVTPVVEEPADEVSVAVVGDTPKVHVVPSCVTVTVWPATVSVPVRSVDDGFAAALKVTVPLPLPLAPLLIVSQAALLVAVQVHPP